MLQAKATKTQIAKTLRRDRSTIHREIKRNWWHDEDVPQADMACDGADAGGSAPLKRRKLEQHEDLRREVIAKLKTGWSPEQIAGRLRSNRVRRTGFATRRSISTSIRRVASLRRLGRYLPQRQKKRKPRYARKARG